MGSCVVGPQLLVLFWKVVKSFKRWSTLEKVGHWGTGLEDFLGWPHFLSIVCFLSADVM